VAGKQRGDDDDPLVHAFYTHEEAQRTYRAICECVRKVNEPPAEPENVGEFKRIV